MPSPINVDLINASTLFDDKDLPALAQALQVQVTRDFYPIWGINCQIFYGVKGKHPAAGHWVLSLLDDADTAGALGYHDITNDGLPLGKIFVRTTLADGGLVSVTASHEILEMLTDPDTNLLAQDGGSRLYAYESADPCESDTDGYLINNIRVSNFVTPAWFESFRKSGPFDFMRKITKPFGLLKGGYVQYLDLNNLRAGWQQSMADRAEMSAKYRMAARPHKGSRRERRATVRSEWIVSEIGKRNDNELPPLSIAGLIEAELPTIAV